MKCVQVKRSVNVEGHAKREQVVTSGKSTKCKIFIQIDLGVSFLRMRDFAPLGYFWGVLEKGYRLDAITDFDAKYVE